MNKEKGRFIERYEQLVKEQQFEEALKEQPLFEDELHQLGYDVIKKNTDMIKNLRDRGLIVRRPYPTIEEFVDQATGYVVKQSTINQMEKSEYRSLRTSGALFESKLAIYNDMEEGQVPLHFEWQYKEHNGRYTTSFTGGSDMFNVVFEKLDEQESEARASEIRSVQVAYKVARQEIDFLLNNLDAVAQGIVNTQYHGSVSR